MLDVITLSDQGALAARNLAEHLPGAELHFHELVTEGLASRSFTRIAVRVKELFLSTDGIVFIGPSGVIVRAIAPLLQSKLSDPPVVVVDIGCRYVVSLVSGHEGGANDLAVTVANALGAEPVITTTTDAARTIIVGLGCRRGCPTDAIVEAVGLALEAVGVSQDEVRFLATADIKADELGLREAAAELGRPLRLISSSEIRACRREFAPSPLAQKNVDLPAVAEPTALLAGRRTTLILPKMKHRGVTVALARESFS